MITTAIGNYPKISANAKSPNLRTAIANFDAGKITPDELDTVANKVTAEIIHEQERAGLDLLTDGQVRWDDGLTYFARKIPGFSMNGLIRYFDTNTYYRQPIVDKELKMAKPISVSDFKFATSITDKPIKAVMPGPLTLAKLSRNASSTVANGRSSVDSNASTITFELARILNNEAKHLEKAGASYIQFDEPVLLRNKEDFKLFAEASKILTQNIQAKTILCLYFKDISGLFPAIFKLPFQVFSLDFVMGKNNFNIIKDFPGEKELGLGLVDARNTKLEPVSDIVNGVQAMSSIVSIDKIHIHPNCGLEFLPRKNAYDKLKRLVEGAHKSEEVLK